MPAAVIGAVSACIAVVLLATHKMAGHSIVDESFMWGLAVGVVVAVIAIAIRYKSRG
jgi:hypothetical protein